MQLDVSLAFDIFCYGVDYGQLISEEERDNEDWVDAFNCYFVARKTAMPSNPLQRRQPHSEEWREAKKKSLRAFKSLIAEIGKNEKEVNNAG